MIFTWRSSVPLLNNLAPSAVPGFISPRNGFKTKTGGAGAGAAGAFVPVEPVVPDEFPVLPVDEVDPPAIVLIELNAFVEFKNEFCDLFQIRKSKNLKTLKSLDVKRKDLLGCAQRKE